MEQKEKCCLCGKETDYFFNTPISERAFYIDGVGQLCEHCYNTMYNKDELFIDSLSKEMIGKNNK